MSHDVFISYSTKDKTIADGVCAKLEEKKIRCWIAPRDVPAGANFSGSIIDAIDTSKVFVLIWSSNTNTSDHILNELNQAFDTGITVIPFRVEDVQPSKSLKYYIGRTHWLDALTPPLEQHIDKLAKRIITLTNNENIEKSELPDQIKRFPGKSKKINIFQFIFGILALAIIFAIVINQFSPFPGNIKTESPQDSSVVNNSESKQDSSAVNNDERLKICQVTDLGGIEGIGFGYTFDPIVWDSIQLAKSNYGIEGKYFESKQISDFEKNLQMCKDWGAKLIFAVGFKVEMHAAVKNAAIQNPQIYYASIDWPSDGKLPNYKGMELAWDQGTFLAGYLSAAMTKSGKVGTFAGTMMPIIQKILDGYYLGVAYYNQQHNTDIKLLGYDPSHSDLAYIIGNWTSLESASGMLDTLISEGADVFLPVCGYVAIESVFNKNKETGIGMAIGTDYDMSQIYPEYSPVVLASVVKRPDVMVYQLIGQVINGEWQDEENYLLSLENGGLALVYGKDWINKIPSNVKDEINLVIADLKTGKINTQIER